MNILWEYWLRQLPGRRVNSVVLLPFQDDIGGMFVSLATVDI